MVIAQPVRRSIRLPGFDYSSSNWYYLTLCTVDRVCNLGKVVGDRAFLSPIGHIVNWELLKLRIRYPEIQMDEYVIMPNHLHVILGIRATVKVAPTLGHLVGAYKSRVIHECLSLYKLKGKHLGKLWQRNYYEHIIRDDTDMERIRQYIHNNPSNWTKDKHYKRNPRRPLRSPVGLHP